MAKPSERLRQIRVELTKQFEMDHPGKRADFTAIWIEALEQYLDEIGGYVDDRIRTDEEQDGKAE